MNIIQHIAFNCRNKQILEDFYTKHFGFKRVRIFHAGEPNEFVMLRLGATCIELFSAAEGDRTKSGAPQPVGFSHLAFEVPNIEASVKALEDEDIKHDDIIDCSGTIPGLKICFFSDPDGNRIELMQGWQDDSNL
ncbi:MAG: VOC family protein [Verrucomicrobiota bacterium]|nr:VOC family protein [Verrucomicrobiota bacterium]